MLLSGGVCMDKVAKNVYSEISRYHPASWNEIPDLGLYMDQVITFITRVYEPLYGGDENITKDELLSPTESVKLPVYGAVNGDRAVCAIVKEGAEFADLKVMLDQNLTGYSYITTKYRVRGYQEAIQTLFTSSVVKTNLYADAFTPCDIKVGFYPMYDEDANYNGFANKYKEHMNKDA
jgi:hypothetical protein